MISCIFNRNLKNKNNKKRLKNKISKFILIGFCFIIIFGFLTNFKFDIPELEKATDAYLKSLSGQILRTITIDKDTLGIYGNAELLTFIGHNGLMEFDLPIENYTKKDNKTRDAIMLACISKDYFQPYFDKFGTNSLLMSTGLMSPEAYTLDAALDSYISGNEKPHVRLQAAKAYHQYQKCGVSAALGLLVND